MVRLSTTTLPRAWAAALGFAVLAAAVAGSGARAQVGGATEPGIVETGASQSNFNIEPTYDGSMLVVFGAIDRERLNGKPFDVVVTVRGPASPLAVWRKGRRAGVWVNAERVEFDAVPNFYAVLSRAGLESIAPLAARKGHGIGFDALDFAPRQADRLTPTEMAGFNAALIRLKQESGLFVQDTNADIVFFGERLFRARVFLPAAAGPGTYRAESFVIQGGTVVGVATSRIRVAKTGIEASLSSAAARHPWLYGVIAVALAAAVGGGASVLLGRK